ncbi:MULTISPECIES: hypothetical protein [unclassified Microcoleus]|uniref:hypothetical protein n=1 Tax=unclassified Microcoleus TaxID=2642155 RepID=UPI001D8F45CE|nr:MULTISPECIES: hypothetical protein [unclassified Microcoleus]MCC3439276.1 hypothetical protein [Microcoleus sp. PH2017_05_CCC_O_A]MCC3472478.1 hypothetical protein [Microcoleus sp. PH2017_13_LAR_U_A]MCC3485021.1 hypothetical protein [Microcoleus sp. PH2017_14_LAR_D_A]MCC3597725.1 hypothetical protein [Microcoleus sp. PH2017_26_ELK_O_A]MCC3622336.1 hypothetical protein [Microcoleus sp. PH2017_36_ELK_O_B]
MRKFVCLLVIGCFLTVSATEVQAQRRTGAYFAWKGATHFGFYNPNKSNPNGASDLIAYCSFPTPGGYQMHQAGIGGDNVGRLTDGQVDPLAFRGACPLPSGYFAWNRATHYSIGDGTYCSFPTRQGFVNHQSRRPQERSFGNLQSDPKAFLAFSGACGN